MEIEKAQEEKSIAEPKLTSSIIKMEATDPISDKTNPSGLEEKLNSSR